MRQLRTAVVLASAGLLALTACSSGGDTSSSESTSAEETTAETSEEATAETSEETTAEEVATDCEPITLRYAFFAPAQTFPGVQMEEFKKEIEARTDGGITVELYPGGALFGSGDIFDGVSAGAVEIGLDIPSYDPARFPFSSVINNPIGIESAEVGSKVFLDLLTEYQPAEFSDFEIITAFTTEPAYFQTQRPVTTVADANGLELRSSGAILPILAQMNAAGVGMPMTEVGPAMQTGVINGYVSSRDVLKDFGLAEQIGYMTDYPMGVASAFVAVMDKAKYDSLCPDYQNALQELKPLMSEFAATYHDNDNIKGSLAFAEEQGVEIVDVDPGDIAQWDAIMTSVADEWSVNNADAGFDSVAVLERARELVAENSGN